MARAILVFRQKVIDEGGNISELVVWRIPASPTVPSGIKYRLAFVRRDEERPAVLYDNHSPKGDHRTSKPSRNHIASSTSIGS